jgi:hypothetical protein
VEADIPPLDIVAGPIQDLDALCERVADAFETERAFFA